MKTFILSTNYIHRLIERCALVSLMLVCFAISPMAQAISPPPDGCYPGFTTAEGCNALAGLGSGQGNTGLGWHALGIVGSGNFNTAVGAGALVLNTADSNTAVGVAALFLNATGHENVAVGTAAMVQNSVGFFNNAVGAFALNGNVDGVSNNAFGASALTFNMHANRNTAIGDVALAFNDSSGNNTASNNTAVGAAALENNVDGSKNTAVGAGAGPNLIAGFNNTYIGDFVGTLANDENSTIRIGDLSSGNGSGSLSCFIGGIFNNFQPVGGAVVEVTLNLANDELGWDNGPSNKGDTALLQRSVLLRRSVSSAAMLNSKVGKVEKLEATVAQQQKQIDTLRIQLKEQAAQIQKVSAQIELNRPAPQTVLNNP